MLTDRLSHFKQIALCGGGEYSALCLSQLQSYGYGDRIIGFIDPDPLMQGQIFFERPVLGPDILRNQNNTAVIMSAESKHGYDLMHRSLSETIDPAHIFANILLVDTVWTSCTGVRDRENVNAVLRKTSIPATLSAPQRFFRILPHIRTATASNRFYERYDPEDDYTRAILDWYTDLYCLDAKHPGILSFQPYSVCAEFIECHMLNQMYWSECAGYMNDESFTICDIGAFTGDSIGGFSLVFGQDRIAKIYAFEPTARWFDSLRFTATHSCLSTRIECICAACGDVTSDSEYRINSRVKSGVMSRNSGTPVRTMRLDDARLDVQGTLCIKMDIDGFEMAALQGAVETIRKYRPYIAICVYHKTDDVWRIPAFLHSLIPEYRFSLRGGPHLVCYGNPNG